ncbi:SPRY domain-containing SOCS box protein 4-like [Pristis pectinata]|uniref:SPRY domain-containing SOCS box protein 4-like n=1 Tax=Pristis pectinata TaxID=685728 RepID=UPI00223E072D|nr:SPRY domain-containing SOCS box protein 4-like [Pristis pectinata]
MGLKWFKAAEEESEGEDARHLLGRGLPMPGRFQLLLELPPVPWDVQLQHSWSDRDCSPNMRVPGGLTARRLPVPDSTDCLRGRVGCHRGLHVWRVSWPVGQRGSHAAVGVGTSRARLQAPGYRTLLGGEDGESWAWGLVDNRLYHAGKALHSYPDVSVGPFPVPESVVVILDSDEGTLSFMVDGRYLGVAFQGLKDKTLYPMVSCVWGNCGISLTYINHLPGQPLTLTDLCRCHIRRILGEHRISEVDSLPLPQMLKNYIQES